MYHSNFPKVVLIGRTNVGKSALFNRITDERKAIVQKESHTTRDRISCVVAWQNKKFELVDTAGMDIDKKDVFSSQIRAQIKSAMQDASIILFVCDIKDGILPIDYKIANLIRKEDKPVILVANKSDIAGDDGKLSEFYNLGIGEPYSTSALHGMGIGDLLDIITNKLPLKAISDEKKSFFNQTIRLAIVGKPNSGKSSLLNKILGEERAIVSEEPGTTRDSVDGYFKKDKKMFIITDTAGIRSKSKIKDAVTYFSIIRTRENVTKSDIVIIVIDGYTGITKEDYKIIDLVQKEFKPFILAMNKWDIVKKEKVDKKSYDELIRKNLKFIYNAPICFISALTGENVFQLIEKAEELAEKSCKNFSTDLLNKILKAIDFNLTRLYSISQTGTNPVKFQIITAQPQLIDDEKLRFLTNIFRKKLGLEGMPIVLKFKGKEYKNKR